MSFDFLTSRRRKPVMDQYLDEFNTDRAAEGQAGGRFDKLYESQLTGFDASKGLADYTRGAVGQARGALDERLMGLREDAAGGGRLNSGLFDQDQGFVVRDAERSLENQLLQASQRAQELQMQNTQAIGAYGSERRGNALDMLTANMDREQARLNAKDQRKAAKKGWGDYLMQGAGIAAGYFGGR